MSESTEEGNDNTKTSDLTTIDEALIQTNLDAEANGPQSNHNESFLYRDEIQLTLKEFNQKLKDNDISIKRIEESMAALYDKLERTPKMEESKVSSKKKSKKKKGKKLDKKGKKKSRKIKSVEKTKSARGEARLEKKNTRRTKSNGKIGRMKNAGKKK